MTSTTMITGARGVGVVHYLDRATDDPICGVRMVVLHRGGQVSCKRCRALAPLKTCPFCGRPPTVWEKRGVEDIHTIACGHCDVSGPSRAGDTDITQKDQHGMEHTHQVPNWIYTRLELVEAWNRRAAP